MNEGSGDHYAQSYVRQHIASPTLAPYRVLAREKLAELSGASSWNTAGFDLTLRSAVDHEFLRRLDDDL